jgi:hypothetical protein
MKERGLRSPWVPEWSRLGASHSDTQEDGAPTDREYVGIDFHRRRSVVVRVSATGEKLSSVRSAKDPMAIAAAVAEAGPDPEVVVEATYGWYWVVDLLQASGGRVHLANPQVSWWRLTTCGSGRSKRW